MSDSAALSESEEQLRLSLPARQRVMLVVPFTCLATASFFGVIWLGYQWLAATAMTRQGVAQVSMMALLVVEASILRLLVLELASTRLAFDRTTIEVKRSVLGVQVARRWYSCYRVTQFVVTHDAQAPDVVRLDIVLKSGEVVLIAANIPTDAFVQLTHAMRRKELAYFREEEL